MNITNCVSISISHAVGRKNGAILGADLKASLACTLSRVFMHNRAVESYVRQLHTSLKGQLPRPESANRVILTVDLDAVVRGDIAYFKDLPEDDFLTLATSPDVVRFVSEMLLETLVESPESLPDYWHLAEQDIRIRYDSWKTALASHMCGVEQCFSEVDITNTPPKPIERLLNARHELDRSIISLFNGDDLQAKIDIEEAKNRATHALNMLDKSGDYDASKSSLSGECRRCSHCGHPIAHYAKSCENCSWSRDDDCLDLPAEERELAFDLGGEA